METRIASLEQGSGSGSGAGQPFDIEGSCEYKEPEAEGIPRPEAAEL